MPTERPASFSSLDGLTLNGTYLYPDAPTGRAAVLVHGGGVTREEGGFFTRLAAHLAGCGVASLRFDLRGHGASEGQQEDLTLASILNDIRVALEALRSTTGALTPSLIGASFGGGLCAYYAAHRSSEVQRLVLLNPQFDYKKRTIDDRPFWRHDHLTPDAARDLSDQGYLRFTPTLRHGRPLFNEVFWFDVVGALPRVTAPTLVVHGTADTLVPIERTREALPHLRTEHHLLEIDGAQHGFAVDDDPQYLNPQSRQWQTEVIHAVTDWLTRA